MGYSADVASEGLTNATAIGAFALAGANNSLVLGSINGINGATANAHVGIGTTTPDTTLHVVGKFKYQDGTESSGKVLTSDGSGLSSWQTPASLTFFTKSTADTTNIIYSDAGNYGKNFLVNTDSVNYDGSGEDAKMMFVPGKYAFRAGAIGTNGWNIDSMGDYSLATGYNTKATGLEAVALGAETTSSGQTSTAMGNNSIASGNASTAMGQETTASGIQSTAMGFGTKASGAQSTAMGNITTASGFHSTAMGNHTTASGDYSTAMGQYSIASGLNCTAFGDNTTATGDYSTALGSHSIASGDKSLVMGNGTKASGSNSVGMGNHSIASGGSSTSMGINTEAKGNGSAVLGVSTLAKSFGEFAIGSYNDTLLSVVPDVLASDSNRVFTVGNGTNNANRNTAFVIQQNGNIGVNTRVPTEKLDIAGNVKIVDGNQGIGKVLTSDANGKASWQAPANDTLPLIADADGNTKIQVEESPNEDVIHFDVAGNEVFTITDTVSTFKGTGRDLLKIKTVNNAVETGLAFQNAGSSYTWSVHRSAANIPDLVISGGNTANDVDGLTERLRITTQGNVGIGTDTATVKFQVGKSGDGTVARANAWNIFSDRRWKTDLAVITNAMEKIEAINGYYYKWRDRPDTTIQVGVIAQEIEAVLPEVVSTDAQGYKSVDYSKLTALLIQGMKEQQVEIGSLESAVSSLQSSVASLQSVVHSLPKRERSAAKGSGRVSSPQLVINN